MKTIEYNNRYLYCKINPDLSLICDRYDDAEDCYNDYMEDIIEDCLDRGYNELETNTILSYYEIWICNANVNWGEV